MTEEKKKKFNIIKTLDDWRWDISPNDVLEGYKYYSFGETLKRCFDNKGNVIIEKLGEIAEKVLLTHHLLYICNRQMDARRIFSDGAEVISNIVEKYYEKDLKFDDYIDKKTKTRTVNMADGTTKEEYKDSYFLKIPENVTFASRYMLTDIACMQKTFNNLNNSTKETNKYNPEEKDKLEEKNRIIDNSKYQNFSEFLKYNSDDITTLAQALYELTYQGVPVIKNSDVKVGKVIENINKKLQNRKVLKKNDKLCADCQFDNKKYNLKRVWCEVRDFLYDPVLQECFKIIIGEKKFNTLKGEENANLSSLELPGDVWNNNSTFAGCFWGEEYTNLENKNNFNSSKFVREQFNKSNDENCWGGCYPHNFDITFNFVPRMCESNNCSICPIFKNENNENKKGKDWENLCHKTKEKYCSFALYATGVKHVCKGENGCEILNIMKEEQNE